MSDPVGGREAEIRTVAAAFNETEAHWFIAAAEGKSHAEEHIAGIAIAALDALRSSGSAAQNQEDDLGRAVDFIRGVASLEHVNAADHAVNAVGKDAREFLAFLAARSPQDEDHEAIKDLRGVVHRHVGRDDSVIISGAEYLRKSRLADQAEFAKFKEENA